MASGSALLAKIARPQASGILQRERLFQTLDQALNSSSSFWITGPPGSGKTALVASYLESRQLRCIWYQVDDRDADVSTLFYYLGLAAHREAPRRRIPLPYLAPQYLPGLPAFARRYFETFYARLKPPLVLVFDNCQEVPSDARFYEVVRESLGLAPAGISLVLISRAGPPPALARPLANRAMTLLGWEELRFNRTEAEELLRKSYPQAIPEQLIPQVCDRTEGWAAGLVLLALSIARDAILPRSSGELHHEKIFDYFASEIFEKLSGETQAFLLKTAFLPQMTARMAQALSENVQAVQILSELSARCYFTTIHVQAGGDASYQYHPLFREFLRSRAEAALPPSSLNGIRTRAAELLEQAGQIEDAVQLFQEAGNEEERVRLILANAEALTRQGRHQTLRSWFSRLSRQITGKYPWLLYWSSLAHLPVDPGASQRLAEEAFALHRARRDYRGMFADCYPAVTAICLEQADFRLLDPWIAVLDRGFRALKTPLPPEIEAQLANTMFLALVLRQPQHPDIAAYRERLERACRSLQDADMRILLEADALLYHIWMGDFPRAAETLDSLLGLARLKKAAIQPLVLANLRTFQAMYHAYAGETEACLRAVKAGLEVMHHSGIAIMEGQIRIYAISAMICAGRLHSASQMLEEMGDTLPAYPRTITVHYHFLRAWHALLVEDLQASWQHVLEGHAGASASGMAIVEMLAEHNLAQVLHRRGESNKARLHLGKFHRAIRTLDSALLEFMYLLARAQFDLAEGASQKAQAHLRRALRIGRKNDYFFFPFWQPSVMADLSAAALEAGIEVEYVRELIRRRGLLPDPSGPACADWPWPVRIATLGGFELAVNGKPVSSPGKAQKKPLELLKLLTCLGGREVGEDRLADELWPDAPGDLGHKSFEITLHRLRRLLGTDAAVTLREGKLSLNPRHCWLDTWELERRIREADDAWRALELLRPQSRPAGIRQITARALESTEKALGLYRGHFLPADTAQPWTVSCRERFRSQFLRLVLRLGSYLEKSGQPQKAAECFEKGLEIDDLAEELYQRLMLCLQRLSQEAAGLAVYDRCRAALEAALHLPPSSKTEAICRSLQTRAARRHP
jgi:LuxR family maltose regulon positive regulatory protein